MRRIGKILLYIFLGGVAVIGLFVALAFWATSGLPDAAKRFADQVTTGDVDGVYASFADELADEVSQQEVSRLLQSLDVLARPAELLVNFRGNSNGQASVQGHWKMGETNRFLVDLNYVWRDGAWQMLGFTFTALDVEAPTVDQEASLRRDSDHGLHSGQFIIA